jgi:hypothetical protein
MTTRLPRTPQGNGARHTLDADRKGHLMCRCPLPPDHPAARREFSEETLSELVRALHARTATHPDTPGLIASWPGVPEHRMPAACGALRRRGHAIRRITITTARGTRRGGWTLGGTTRAPSSPTE